MIVFPLPGPPATTLKDPTGTPPPRMTSRLGTPVLRTSSSKLWSSLMALPRPPELASRSAPGSGEILFDLTQQRHHHAPHQSVEHRHQSVHDAREDNARNIRRQIPIIGSESTQIQAAFDDLN